MNVGATARHHSSEMHFQDQLNYRLTIRLKQIIKSLVKKWLGPSTFKITCKFTVQILNEEWSETAIISCQALIVSSRWHHLSFL